MHSFVLYFKKDKHCEECVSSLTYARRAVRKLTREGLFDGS